MRWGAARSSILVMCVHQASPDLLGSPLMGAATTEEWRDRPRSGHCTRCPLPSAGAGAPRRSRRVPRGAGVVAPLGRGGHVPQLPYRRPDPRRSRSRVQHRPARRSGDEPAVAGDADRGAHGRSLRTHRVPLDRGRVGAHRAGALVGAGGRGPALAAQAPAPAGRSCPSARWWWRRSPRSWEWATSGSRTD